MLVFVTIPSTHLAVILENIPFISLTKFYGYSTFVREMIIQYLAVHVSIWKDLYLWAEKIICTHGYGTTYIENKKKNATYINCFYIDFE